MVRVKMLTTSAGPDGTVQAGTTIPVDDETANELVTGGYAIYVDPPSVPSKQDPAPEPEPIPEPEPEPAPAEQKSLSQMNKAELQALSSSLGLPGDGTNDALRERIAAAREAAKGGDA